MAANLELKARLRDPVGARAVARRVAGEPVALLRQSDEFFHVPYGRLKLRTIEGVGAELIWYQRPDAPETRRSDYQITPAPDGPALSSSLGAALGVRVVIRKTRILHLYHGVRIHLDDVEGLGDFLELEAVLGPDLKEESATRRLEDLRGAFSLRDEDLVSVAYADLAIQAK